MPSSSVLVSSELTRLPWFLAFAGHGLNKQLKTAVINAESGKGATVFGYYVDDPEQFGIVKFDKEDDTINIEKSCEV